MTREFKEAKVVGATCYQYKEDGTPLAIRYMEVWEYNSFAPYLNLDVIALWKTKNAEAYIQMASPIKSIPMEAHLASIEQLNK